MKPLDNEQLAAVEAAFRRAKEPELLMPEDRDFIDQEWRKIMTELTRKPYEPRDGEVFAFSNAITPAHSVDWGFCRKLQGIAFEAENIRPLRLSEMPRQVEALHRVAAGIMHHLENGGKMDKATRNFDLLREAVNDFDEVIKP